MSRAVWRRIAATLLVAAALAFLGLTIANNWAQLATYPWRVHPVRLAFSVPALSLAFVWGVFVWHGVLRRFEGPVVPLPRLIRIWFLSTLTRYIPGKIWQFVSAGQLAQAEGLSAVRMLTSLVTYMGLSILSAAVLAAITLPLDAYGFGRASVMAVDAFAGLSIFLAHPRVLNGMLALVPRVLHRETLVWTGSWLDGILLLVLGVASWLVYGVAFTLLVGSLVDIPWTTMLPLSGVNALSFLVGYFVFIAPAGLGAREAVMTVLLAPYAPAGVAVLIAVAARLWTVAGEMLGAVVVMLGIRRRPVNRGEPG